MDAGQHVELPSSDSTLGHHRRKDSRNLGDGTQGINFRQLLTRFKLTGGCNPWEGYHMAKYVDGGGNGLSDVQRAAGHLLMLSAA
eukprot:1159061-Pelagomonas_calceolata.AAC.9